jgi:hypothetical protein
MDPAKIVAIKDRVEPKNVKQVQQFLGMSNYYRRFIRDYARIVAPLYELLKKENKFLWSEFCKNSFSDLKKALVSYPVLRQPDFSKQFILHTDASNLAIGVVLSQEEDDKDHAVAYFSRLLKGAELNYSISEKECLGVVFGVQKCRHYIWGTKFKIVTDHSALAWLMNIKDPSSRLTRWALKLQPYEFTIVHRKGLLHSNCDALSRPVLNTIIQAGDEEGEASAKALDLFEDEALLHYLRFGRHLDGLPRKQVNRVCNLAGKYEIAREGVDEIFLFKKLSKDKQKTFYLIVPPMYDRLEIIENAHKLGHFQAETTTNRILEKYYWKNLKLEVEQFIRRCEPCKREHKVIHYNHPAIANRVTGIFHKIGMDLTFGFPEVNGFHGFLNIVEYLSGYVYTIPIITKTDDEICLLVWNYICIFGPPRIILTDQGNEFNNHLLNFLLNKIKVHHLITSAYNPRVDGKVERYNYLIAESLRKCMDGESDKTKWVQWLSFVTLAFNSKFHTRTGFTPYELIFGRKMNTFESWHADPEVDEAESLANRSAEIKRMVEESHVSAIDRIKQAQVSQKKQQDNNQNVQFEQLEVGSIVYVKTMGIQSKMAPRYRGPFKVVQVTTNGNYILENTLGERMFDTYPLSRLKVIKEGDEESQQQVFRVQKIIEHRAVGDDFEYLVKWKDFSNKHNSWEKKENFQELEMITNYWKKNKPEIPIKVNPPRAAKNKGLKFNPLTILSILFLLLLPFSSAFSLPNSSGLAKQDWFSVSDNFYFCERPSALTGVVLDVDHNCLITEEIKKIPIFADKTYRDFHILSKMVEQVKGRAWECSKEVITVSTYKNWAFLPSRSVHVEVEKLDRIQCMHMIESKKCVDNTMVCTDLGCDFDGTPEDTYTWLTYVTKRGYRCHATGLIISAQHIESKLFSSTCVATDLECHVGKSIYIWTPDVYRRCPYNYIDTIYNVTTTNDIIFAPEKHMAFQLTNTVEKIEECGNALLYSTKEGLFISFNNNVKTFPKSDSDLSVIHELLLAEADGEAYKSYKESLVIKNEICENFRESLKVIRNSKTGFVKSNDFLGRIHVFYVDNGIITIPKCVEVKSIMINNNKVECERPFVKFSNFTGYIDKELIITTNNNNNNNYGNVCEEQKYILFPESKSMLAYENNKYYIQQLEHVAKIGVLQIQSMSSINFPHSTKLFHPYNIMREIARANNRSIGNITASSIAQSKISAVEEKDEIVGSSIGEEISSWSNNFVDFFVSLGRIIEYGLLAILICGVLIMIIIIVRWWILIRKKRIAHIIVLNELDRGGNRMQLDVEAQELAP